MTLQTHESQKPLFHYFLNRSVIVEVERGLTVEGRLVSYVLPNMKPHKPFILIIESGKNRTIIRGTFQTIKVKT